MPEGDVVTRIRAGDAVAFETLFREHHQALVSFASALLGMPDAADDVVADVFAGLWQQRASWKPVSIRAYLYGSVRHRVLNRLRDAKKTVTWDPRLDESTIQLGIIDATLPDAQLEYDEQTVALRAAIDRLSPVRRLVMSLRWRQEMEVIEIAEVMGISANAVQLHISRAVKWLREVMPPLS